MSLKENFKKAAENAVNLKGTPKDDELLEVYALYKQATVGDVNTSKPGLFDLKGKAKWEAWNSKVGTPQETAKQAYVDYVNKLIEIYGLK